MIPDNDPSSPKKINASDPKKLLLFTLLTFAALVLFVLPQYVADPWVEAERVAFGTTSDETELTPSKIAEKKQYRQDSQALLAEIMELINDLDQIAAGEWATNTYGNAKELIQKGDKQYLEAKYESSIKTYAEALEALKGIRNRSEETLEQVLSEGFEYLEDLNSADAAIKARLALLIGPNNADALELGKRAKSLPSFIEMISVAEKYIQSADIDAAIFAYQEALTIDSAHDPTRQTLNVLKQQKRERDFYAQMSTGFQALDENRFGEAQKAFQKAIQIDPKRPEAQQALDQLSSRRSQYNTDRALKTAFQLEAMEEWQKAVEVYDKLIAEDDSLTKPKIRRLTASVRAQIDMQIDTLLNDPLKLAEPAIFRQAKKLLDDIKGIDGGKKLESQLDELQEALDLSQVPIEVRFRSDGLTNVTLYRVGEFGTFTDKKVKLKPGVYQVAGSRIGFTDVQIRFTVKPDSSNMPIEVRCTKAI